MLPVELNPDHARQIIADGRAAVAEMREAKPTAGYMLGRYDALMSRVEPLVNQLEAAMAEIVRLGAYEREFTNAALRLNSLKVPLQIDGKQLPLIERIEWLRRKLANTDLPYQDPGDY